MPTSPDTLPTVSVITPVWNRADLTQAFLYRNWLLYQSIPHVEFIIVNNGSTDGTDRVLGQWLDRMGQRLTVLHNEANRGFGPANNQGAAAARGEWLIFLSNDVAPTGDYVGPLVAALADHPAALAGAELYNHDTGWNSLDGRLYPYLAGWCLAATKATWQALGGFDEQYVPCDYEDIDLSATAQAQARPLVPVARLPLRHAFGQTAQHLSGGRLAVTLKNQELFRAKWSKNEQQPSTRAT